MLDRLSADELRRLVNYDPETGVMTRKIRTANRINIGDAVGTLQKSGYLGASIGGLRARLHQFAWLYVHGTWPELDIDHIDGDKTNNRISNLRLATISQNAANMKITSRNKSGFKGVRLKGKKWRATIGIGRHTIYLGVFDTPDAAHAAYCEAATRLFGEFARAA